MKHETQTDLPARLGQLTAQIEGGRGDLVAALEERESIKRQMEAERIRTSKVADDQYKANVEVKSAEFRARAIPPADRLADQIPRLLWDLAEYAELELEAMRGGAGNVNLAEETGIPFGLAQQLREAINQLSSTVVWNYDFLSDPQKKNPLPHTKQMTIDLRRFKQTDIHGRPLEGHTYIGGNP